METAKQRKIMKEVSRRNVRKRAVKKAKMEVVAKMMEGMSVREQGPQARRKRKRRSRNAASGGEIFLRRKELVTTFTAADKAADLFAAAKLRPEEMTWLKNVSKAFEKYQWVSVKMFWKPAVGTTVGGLVSLGMRWEETEAIPSKRTEIVSHTPNRTHAVWEDGEGLPLVIPSDKLQTRRWYLIGAKGPDGGPGQVEVGVSTSETHKLLGELWVEYSIRMAGTKA